MSRPKCCYNIGFFPKVKEFMPEGKKKGSACVEITPQEVEAMRLKHLKGLEQTEAAKKMGISQSSFQRLLSSAHTKVTRVIVGGKNLKICK